MLILSCRSENDGSYRPYISYMKFYSSLVHPSTTLISSFIPNSTGALAFPRTIGQTNGWLMLTMRSETERVLFSNMYSCCSKTFLRKQVAKALQHCLSWMGICRHISLRFYSTGSAVPFSPSDCPLVAAFPSAAGNPISRFARNTVDTLNFTRRLSELGVNIVFMNLPWMVYIQLS